MQAFGIEIRKIGNTESLYKEVDLVLNKMEVGEDISRAVQIQATAHALQRMLNTERHFDVCTIKSLSAMCQISIPRERILVYESIHCISWSEMLPEFRQTVIALVLDDFRGVLKGG